jgi:hypothetical protein
MTIKDLILASGRWHGGKPEPIPELVMHEYPVQMGLEIPEYTIKFLRKIEPIFAPRKLTIYDLVLRDRMNGRRER